MLQAVSVQIANRIGGAMVPGSVEVPVFDPATGERIASLAGADEAIAAHAVATARAAFDGWSETPPAERARLLARFARSLEADRDELARLITREHGKPHADALGSIQRGLEVVEFAAAAPHLLKGEVSEQVSRNVSTRTLKRPLGVCVGITPFNYPAMIPLWMFPMAIVCGNTFVLKPSERAPSAPMRLAELLDDCGAPPGVLNVVHGDRYVAEAIVAHPDVRAVSFVGSTAAARAVYANAAAHGKRVQALGGAKNHAIVMPDAKASQVIDGLLNGAFNSAGQRCMAVAVAVFVGPSYDRLLPALVEAAAALRVGPGNDASTQVPPVISAHQADRIDALVAGAAKRGARLALDGRRQRDGGYFVGPTIIDGVGPGDPIYDEEVFGPVLIVMRADSLDAAIDLANEHPLGNGAVLFTTSGESAARFEQRIACGMPGINVAVPSPVAYHSFGGWKQSLFGDLAMHGVDAIAFYTKRKVITSRWD
jgi:malonate-semialdehyde dehydrogenase (acetylating)/methylmalonate-semialdehyde dehydrogenase